MAENQWQQTLDALQAQITNLRNTVDQQNAQIIAGNAQNAALQAQQAQWLLPAANISRKVETLADPGRYSGERAKFMEWWTKMKVWVRVNDTVLPLWFDKAAAVWSRMEGPIAGRYAANRLNECTRQNFWPEFDDLCIEVEAFFSPQMSTEWAKQELRKLKQGGSRIEDFCHDRDIPPQPSHIYSCPLAVQTSPEHSLTKPKPIPGLPDPSIAFPNSSAAFPKGCCTDVCLVSIPEAVNTIPEHI